MSSDPVTGPDADARLGALLDEYQRRRRADPGFGLGALREEAGELFEQLTELVSGLDLLHACFDEDERAPEKIGEYEVVKLLGRGATGVVYEAAAPDGARVALKVLRQSLALSKRGQARFQHEFEALQRLDHPHIVKVLDRGEADGRLFLVMDLVDGAPLTRLEGRTEPEIAALFAPVARALAAAARAGLVHRDLKPGNLLHTRDDRLLVTDFSIAKIAGESLTATTVILGTPGFLSPEQASGDSRGADARTDVYGLGAALFFALTGDAPVDEATLEETFSAIVTVPPDLSRCPSELGRIAARCLEKRPDDRYPDADALADELERVAGVATARRRAWWPYAAAAAILLGIVAWSWGGPGAADVVTFPEARVTIDGDDVTVEREGFETWRGQAGPTVHLRPRDPFDADALAAVADAYGTRARLPRAEPSPPMRTRGRGTVPPPNGAFDRELARYPAEVRDEPHIHALAIATLLAAGEYGEAYEAARALAGRHPGRRVPLQLALLALRGLGGSGTAAYRELHERYSASE